MYEVQIPKMGMSTLEVVGDALVEIEGDKSSFVIEADVAGTVEAILVEAGASSEVGAVVCTLRPDE